MLQSMQIIGVILQLWSYSTWKLFRVANSQIHSVTLTTSLSWQQFKLTSIMEKEMVSSVQMLVLHSISQSLLPHLSPGCSRVKLAWTCGRSHWKMGTVSWWSHGTSRVGGRLSWEQPFETGCTPMGPRSGYRWRSVARAVGIWPGDDFRTAQFEQWRPGGEGIGEGTG